MDEAGQRPGMYWLTGSQCFVMMKAVSESLAGRIGIIDLHSLSQKETGQPPFPALPLPPSRPPARCSRRIYAHSQSCMSAFSLVGIHVLRRCQVVT